MLIQEMRNRSEGVVTKFIVYAIIVVFALFGFGSITTFLTPVPKVASVNGVDITRQEFDLAVERERRIMIARNQSPSDIDEEAIRDKVFQELINTEIMVQATDDVGLYYSDERLDQDIINTPVFQEEGVFSTDQFRRVMGGLGYSPLQYKMEMARDKKIQQLTLAVATTAFMTDAESRRAASLAQQQRDIAYLLISLDSLTDKNQVDDGAVKEYYEMHSDEFMTDETVDLQYLEIQRSEIMGQIDLTEEEISAYYETEKKSYAQKERRRYAHILIEVNEDVTADVAKNRIQEVYSKIQEGEDFAELARTYSDDTLSAEKGGDLEFQEAGGFVEEFEAAGSTLSYHEVSAPVLTEYGYHLIKLLGIEEEEIPSYEDIRSQMEKDMRENLSQELFLEKSSKLGEIAFESADLLGPSDELGLPLKTTGHISRSETQGIGSNKRVMEIAYSTDLLEDGNNSDIIEITPDHHVVIRVLEHHPSELKAISEVKEQIAGVVARERAAIQAEEQARDIVKMLDEGSLTRFVADKYNVEWQVQPDVTRQYMGMDRQVNDEAFRLPRPGADGKSVGYTILNNGDAVVISVTRVQNVSADDLLDGDVRSISKALSTNIGTNDYTEFKGYYNASISINN